VQDVRIAIRRYSIPEHLRNLAIRSDGSWYISLARDGYDRGPFNLNKEHNWAFFPLYPLTVRFFSYFTGQYRLTAIALSNLFFFLALILLHKTVVAFGYGQAIADRTLFYLAIFPTSYFLSLPWTSALFLVVSVGGFWAGKTGRWWLAGMFAGLASATRYNGIFILPALVILYWQENGWFRFKRDFFWLLLAPMGLLSFMAYLYWLTGNALAFADAQSAWNVRWGFFLQPIFTFLISPFELSSGWNFRLVNFLAAMLALTCSALMIKRREYAWALYTIISVLAPLSTVTLEGQTRYVIVLFPVFVMLALLGRSKQIDQTIYVVFLTLLTILTAFFGFYLSPAMI
jgi:Gpi18-like mannosyltransferase